MKARRVVKVIRKILPSGELVAQAPGHRLQPLPCDACSFQCREVEIGERHTCTECHRIAHGRMGLTERVDVPKRVCHGAIDAGSEGRLRGRLAAAAMVGAKALCHGVQAIPCPAHAFRGREIEV